MNLKKGEYKALSGVVTRLAAFLMLLGIFISLIVRQTEEIKAGEGQIINEQNLSFTVEQINLREVKSIFFSKELNAKLNLGTTDGQTLEVSLFPPRTLNGKLLHLTRFGFAPGITIKKADGEAIEGYMMLGTFHPWKEKIARTIPRNPPPRVMLGVGTFPPEMEDFISLPKSPYSVFLRIVGGEINGKNYGLNPSNYYLHIMKGKLEKPRYKVMIVKDNSVIFRGTLKEGESAVFDGNTLTISGLVYWVGINVVNDLGFYIFFAGLLALILGVLSKITLIAFGIKTICPLT